MISSPSVLSACSSVISSMISCGLRWVISSPPLGFFTERSKVAGAMLPYTATIFSSSSYE